MLEGITTTIDLHKKILKHDKFIKSNFDTNWLAKENSFKFVYNLLVANHKSSGSNGVNAGLDEKVHH